MGIQKTAALVIIGDEITSGKVRDENSPFLIHHLSKLGVKILSCNIIPDDMDLIGEAVRNYSERVDWLFTAGGVGPTPDDVTRESLAKAYNVPYIIHPQLEQLIRAFYGEKCKPAHLRMSWVPKGTLLLPTASPDFPQLQFRNIFIFPGVPEFLQKKFLSIEKKFQGEVFAYKDILLETEEGEITPTLQNVLEKYPEIKLGSYPEHRREGKDRVKLIVEHKNENYVEEVYLFLVAKLANFLI